ncbi:MAG: hypothetical protein R3E87_06785 [Burkholderiaceae bacterium]
MQIQCQCGQFKARLTSFPRGTPDKFDLKGVLSVLPFILKGVLSGRSNPSPFFPKDGVTAIVVPHVLTEAERRVLGG